VELFSNSSSAHKWSQSSKWMTQCRGSSKSQRSKQISSRMLGIIRCSWKAVWILVCIFLCQHLASFRQSSLPQWHQLEFHQSKCKCSSTSTNPCRCRRVQSQTRVTVYCSPTALVRPWLAHYHRDLRFLASPDKRTSLSNNYWPIQFQLLLPIHYSTSVMFSRHSQASKWQDPLYSSICSLILFRFDQLSCCTSA
jgi:hypothetical protein